MQPNEFGPSKYHIGT